MRALTIPNSALGVEALEGRDCPASVYLYAGVLTVTGTAGNDLLRVTESGGQIHALGYSFDAASVASVVITGLGGDDDIRDLTTRGSTIYGGMGNDTIRAGRWNDTVFGGAGDDVIYGEQGADRLTGGGGNDILDGGAGANTLNHGSANRTRGNTGIEAEIIRLVNNYRRASGLSALRTNGELNFAADLHSRDMTIISGRFGPWEGMQHRLLGTTQPEITDRLDRAGYDEWSQAFRYGENIAFGYRSAADVVRGWIDSPSHRQNILNPSFTDTGVSVRVDPTGRLFYTQNFGMLA